MEIETARLKLRQWKTSDLSIFAELNADPEVMKYFPALLSKKESDKLAQKCQRLVAKRGWSFWALELKESKKFIGFLGLHDPDYLPISPCVEIGWRLHKDFWRKGYATEAARTALDHAFQILDLNEVVSFTTLTNRRSRAVMERLGFHNCKQNFFHPKIDKNHVLSEHVLYKLTKSNWLTQRS